MYALGFSRKSRFVWTFLQCLIVILLAQAIVFSVSSVLYGDILEYAEQAAEKEATDANAGFSDAAIAEDGAKQEFTVQKDPYAVPLGAGCGTVVLLVLSYFISADIAKKGARLKTVVS